MTANRENAHICPLCGGDNQCGNVRGAAQCWCSSETFPEGIFQLVPPDQLRKACICNCCLVAYKKGEEA